MTTMSNKPIKVEMEIDVSADSAVYDADTGTWDVDVYLEIGALGKRTVEGAVSMAPRAADGVMDAAGSGIDDWMSAALANEARELTEDGCRQLCEEIEAWARQAIKEAQESPPAPKRAITVEQDGQLAGTEAGRVFFNAAGFRPNSYQYIGLGSIEKARALATRLNSAASDADALTVWEHYAPKRADADELESADDVAVRS